MFYRREDDCLLQKADYLNPGLVNEAPSLRHADYVKGRAHNKIPTNPLRAIESRLR